MGLRKILTVSEPALHKVCKPMVNFDNRLFRLLEDRLFPADTRDESLLSAEDALQGLRNMALSGSMRKCMIPDLVWYSSGSSVKPLWSV